MELICYNNVHSKLIVIKFAPVGLSVLITIVSLIIQIASIIIVKARKTSTNLDNMQKVMI